MSAVAAQHPQGGRAARLAIVAALTVIAIALDRKSVV